MSFVFRALMEAARDWVVFIQIAKCSDPRASTMEHTWFVWNALSCVYFSITECFGVAARRPDEIKHVNSIEVISLIIMASSTGLTAVSKFKPRLPAHWAVGTHRKGPSRMEIVTSRMNWPIRNSTRIRLNLAYKQHHNMKPTIIFRF